MQAACLPCPLLTVGKASHSGEREQRRQGRKGEGRKRGCQQGRDDRQEQGAGRATGVQQALGPIPESHAAWAGALGGGEGRASRVFLLQQVWGSQSVA